MGKLDLQIYYKIEKSDICTTLYLHKIYKAQQKFTNPEHCPYPAPLHKTCVAYSYNQTKQ